MDGYNMEVCYLSSYFLIQAVKYLVSRKLGWFSQVLYTHSPEM